MKTVDLVWAQGQGSAGHMVEYMILMAVIVLLIVVVMKGSPTRRRQDDLLEAGVAESVGTKSAPRWECIHALDTDVHHIQVQKIDASNFFKTF